MKNPVRGCNVRPHPGDIADVASGTHTPRGSAVPWTSPRAALLSHRVPAVIGVLAVPFLRPNAMGEGLSHVGLLLMAAAATAALLRPGAADEHRRPSGNGAFDPATALVACLGLGYLYVVVREAVAAPAPDARATFQGIILTVGALMALLVLCRDPKVRLAFARGVVVLLAVLCASYAVTAVLWAVTGVGSGLIGAIPIGRWGPQPVYFPFTTTVSTQPVFGIDFPRFTGVGREPGWMAMYCAAGFFLADMAGVRNRLVKPLLVVGVIGTVSTAGFGVFVVTWAYHRFLRDRGGVSMVNYLRQVGGTVAVLLAAWLAVAAPVLGLSAKSTQNATSIDDRQDATDAGLRALFDNPWGGLPSEAQGGINLISDVAVSGLPFVVLICLGLLMASTRTVPTRHSNAVVLIVFATLLLSQPAKDSTWAFAMVVLACTLRRPDAEPHHRPDSDHVPTRSSTPDRVTAAEPPGRTIEGTP